MNRRLEVYIWRQIVVSKLFSHDTVYECVTLSTEHAMIHVKATTINNEAVGNERGLYEYREK